MNHVGKQVETVATHTLLIAGSEARASAGLMSVRISHLVEILLPKRTARGSRSIRMVRRLP
jgi:hypothetical protein